MIRQPGPVDGPQKPIVINRVILQGSLNGTHFWGGETSNKYMVILRDFPKKKHVLFGPHVDPCIITPMQWPYK